MLNKSAYLVGGEFADLAEDSREAVRIALEGMSLHSWLEKLRQQDGSDLHLTVGYPPTVRVSGELHPMDAAPLKDGEIQAMLYPLINDEQIQEFEKSKELDFAFSPTIDSRFRVNMHWQKGHAEAALRNIPTSIKTFGELNLPVRGMVRFCGERSGLILIAGTTGAGKATTMASLIGFMNKTQDRVVITVENPIEYTFKNEKCIVKQREIGYDTESYAKALRHVLRQDPDVIGIGELIDGECLVAAIERIINFFPPEHANAVRQQLSSCLVGVLFQRLVPAAAGGRILATELLLANSALRHMIREGRYMLMESVIQTGRAVGMHTYQSSLKELLDNELITHQTFLEFSDKQGAAAPEDSQES